MVHLFNRSIRHTHNNQNHQSRKDKYLLTDSVKRSVRKGRETGWRMSKGQGEGETLKKKKDAYNTPSSNALALWLYLLQQNYRIALIKK